MCVSVFSNIFSEITGPTEAKFHVGKKVYSPIGEESLFKWSRSFVVFHYCQPPGGGGGGGGGGTFSRDFTINLSLRLARL